MELPELTREAVAKQLVEKHNKALEITREEFEQYQALENEFDKAAEGYKSERDKINEQVQELKEQRQLYYTDSKELRKEFMTKAQKKKSMSNIPMEVLILTKQIDQFEWEIQTEATNVDEEKRLVKRIKDNIEKLHNYAEMYKEHEEISNAVRKLTSELRRKLRKAEHSHQTMLSAVNKSDEFHKQFVDCVMKLRDARAKRIGFQREVEKHTKALEHWQNIVNKEAKKVFKAAPEPTEDKKNGQVSTDKPKTGTLKKTRAVKPNLPSVPKDKKLSGQKDKTQTQGEGQ